MPVDELLDLMLRWEEGGGAATPEELCRDRPELLEDARRQIGGLRRIDAAFAAVADTSAAADDNRAFEFSVTEPPPAVGDRFGPYQLVRLLGQGGMGEVWLAEQTEPVRRHVAVKFVRTGRLSDEAVARFAAERQALALMDHPHIAKILDAGFAGEPGGASPGRRPFFAMEFVAGVPITRYCDEERLPVRDRLRLFVEVSEAVQHAHQKGIIHRDLKPSNVLVAKTDRVVPRVIDFGIAKATGPRLTDETIVTIAGCAIGTLEYMAPEQARPNNPDVDTRADVYALGVMLYELLSGGRPFGSGEVDYAEMIRLIREVEPPPPSRRLADSADAAEIAARRGTDPRRVVAQLRGDLDWIALKCLEKERPRRYDSAAALAADVQRYLADEPVLAGPPSRTYRLKKFVRRNKGAVAAATIVVLALVGGIAATSWQSHEAELARRSAVAASDLATSREKEAKAQADLATAVSNFLQYDLLALASSEGRHELGAAGLGKDATVRDLLDRASQRIEGRFAEQPLIEAAIRWTIGSTYRKLGEVGLALPHLERCAALRMAAIGPDHVQTLRAQFSVGTAYYSAGRYADAIRLFEPVYRAQETGPNPDEEYALITLNNLALAYYGAGRLSDAVRTLEEVRDRRAKLLGADATGTLDTIGNLAALYAESGRLPDAIRSFEHIIDDMTAKLGPRHPSTLNVLNNLAVVYGDSGRKADSIRLFKQVHEAKAATLGAEHPDTLKTEHNLASAYKDAQKLDDAIRLFEHARDGYSAKLGPNHAFRLDTLAMLGQTYQEAGRTGDAETTFRELLKVREGTEPDGWATFEARSLLGGALAAQKKYDDAGPLLVEGFEGLKQRYKRIPPRSRRDRFVKTVNRLIQYCTDRGLKTEADKWEAEGLAVVGDPSRPAQARP
jgi:serine/threonine protein kinase/tetratricopeptide (TPR) repeat protein